MENQNTMENQVMDQALDQLNKIKKQHDSHDYFKPEFTKYSINEDGNVEQTRDWYDVYRLRAIEISREHGIFEENMDEWIQDETFGPYASYGQSITDDDTISDWIYQYEGNLGKIQKDYPKLELGEIMELFTWNTMCQQRAFSPMPNSFTNTKTFIVKLLK